MAEIKTVHLVKQKLHTWAKQIKDFIHYFPSAGRCLAMARKAGLLHTRAVREGKHHHPEYPILISSPSFNFWTQHRMAWNILPWAAVPTGILPTFSHWGSVRKGLWSCPCIISSVLITKPKQQYRSYCKEKFFLYFFKLLAEMECRGIQTLIQWFNFMLWIPGMVPCSALPCIFSPHLREGIW